MNRTQTKLALAVAFVLPLSAQAAVRDFSLVMDQAQEAAAVGVGTGKRVPLAGLSEGFGAGFVRYDDVANVFSFLSMSGVGLMGSIVNQHIHLGAPGVSGAVILPLSAPILNSAGTFSYFITGLGGFADANEAALFAGNTYVNIHTSFDTVGEIRGQLVPVQAVPEPEIYMMMLTGIGVVGWMVKRRRGETRSRR